MFPRGVRGELRRENAEHRTKAKRGDALAQRLVLAYAHVGSFSSPGVSSRPETPGGSALSPPDNLPGSARRMDADQACSHSAPAISNPKMPGEPMRVQPSRARPKPHE